MPELRTGSGQDMMSDDRKTFIQYGKGARGLIGITLKPNARNTWDFSLPLCCRVKKDIREMTHHEMSTRNLHKEEIMSRMVRMKMTVGNLGKNLKSQ